MTRAYLLYAAPRRTGRVHLSRDGAFTLCGWYIRSPWTAVTEWRGYVCLTCRQAAARLAAEATE